MTQSCGQIEITDPQGGNGGTGPDDGDGQQDQQSSGFAKEALVFGGTAMGTYAIIKKLKDNET